MNTDNIYIALDNVRSLHNVGAIMRTCSFFGIKNIILIGYSGTTYNFKGDIILHPDLLKTSLGSEKDLNILIFPDTDELFSFSEDNSLKIVSVEQHHESINMFSWKPDYGMILIFGSEIAGVSKNILEKSNSIVEIEKFGNKNSLNVATVVGIVLSNIKKKD